MKTIETTVYEFDELNDKAKDKARDWYRERALDYDWWDYGSAEATEIATLNLRAALIKSGCEPV